MTKMPTSKSNNGKDKFNNRVLETDISYRDLPNKQYEPASMANSKSVASELETLPTNSQIEVAGKKELAEVEKPNKDRFSSIFQNLKAKTAAALMGSAVMLPILGIGTATYYFGSQTVNKQAILAKSSGNIGLSETELARLQGLLTALLLGTGTTALLSGAIAALITEKLFDSVSKISDSEATDGSIQYRDVINNLDRDRSDRQQDVLKAIVEEARDYLNCDRVIVYSLDRQNGEIIAESVAPGYRRCLGITVEDPWEAKYLDKYRSGVKTINDLDRFEMTDDCKQQLEAMQVKAILATSIVSEGNLFGLLVAHQCDRRRQWRKGETEFLHQLGKRTGLAVKNVQLLDDMDRMQTQAKIERKWTNYFAEAIQYIRASIERDDVLDISVEEVRRVLDCDRVLIYSLDRDNRYGAVIAESVCAGYPRALNKTIEDSCFEAIYLDRYRNGGVRAIDNIYEAETIDCYIEQLESLEVKANLVTPIINEGKLFGLLVAHQCSQPRHWQQHEIRWITQIATQVCFALDNAKLLAASAKKQIQAETERKWTNYFTNAVRHIRASIEQGNVLDVSVQEVRRVLNCDRVLVYSLDRDDSYGTVAAESVCAGYPKALNKTIEDPCFEAKYLDKYRDGKVQAIDNIQEAGMSDYYIEQLERLEVKANLVTPILNEGKLFGLLVAHQCSQPRHWQQHEIRWVRQIATEVGFALDKAQLLRKAKEAIPTQLLNNFSQVIGEGVNRSELLKIAVEQARKVIQLDRVIVYQFDNDLNGNIATESVAPGYPRALSSQIEDPYLKREFVEQYRQGKTKAIANVDRADLTIRDLEQLESLSVKAVVVVPILQGDRLFGLLIGHQCQQPRSWSQSEIDLFTGLALQLGFALDRVDLKEQLDAAKNVQTNKPQRQLEQGDREFPRSIEQAQSIVRAKIEHSTANSFVAPQFRDREASTNTSKEVTTAQEAIAEAIEKMEVLNQSQQNLYQMVNIINELKQRLDRSSLPANELPQLPMEEITIKFSEAVNEPIASYDYDIDPTTGELVSEATSSLSMNQFIDDISDLSDKISQQSLIVTHSFQKLAEFAQQLSERKKQ